jgi:hypothetical protein
MVKPLHAGLLLLMLLPLAARGQASIVVDTGDNPLVIKGWVGDENSFIGNIGVTLQVAAAGSSPLKLIIYRSDLKLADGTAMIGRQSVAITGDQLLAPDTTSTYQVKVTGVQEPGEYTGKIYLVLAGQPRDAAVPVDVKLTASVRPALSLLTENDRLQVNLVNCHYDCWLARVLLPAAAFQVKTDLGFEKPLAAPLILSGTIIAVKGDHTRYKLTDEQLKIFPLQPTQLQQPGGSNGPGAQSSPTPQGAGAAEPPGQKSEPFTFKKYLTLPVAIVSSEIPADHYTGSIYLAVAGQGIALKVPVDLNVRSGPFWPLLILVVSILLGRLYKFMQDKGNAIADAGASLNRIEFRLRDAHAQDAEIIMPMLGTARDLVHQNKAAEAAAAANAISARLSTLGELRQIETRLKGRESEAPVALILTDIRQARENIRLQQDDKAKALITKIKDALVTLAAAPASTDSDPSDLADAVARANAASAAVAVLGTVQKKAAHRLRSALVMLSGLSDEFRTGATLLLARPLLWLALLLGLLALGLKTLYVDNPIFGANPFTDFLGLMFWGLSADVASRALSGLRINNANAPGQA